MHVCVQEDHEKTSLKGIISTNGDVLGEVDILCKQGRHCTGTHTMKKRLSVSTRSVPSKRSSHDHWLPSVHEDYYGPTNHKPKHH